MWIKDINSVNKTLLVAIPLTKGTDKTRIKKRAHFNEYGLPVPTKQEPFSPSCYVEWQIGYDVITSDTKKLERTSIKDKIFIGANQKEKTLYELSEYIYYFYKWNIIKTDELQNIKSSLQSIGTEHFLDRDLRLVIERDQPLSQNILDIEFSFTRVKYPLLIHKFKANSGLIEIIITERQYAVGVQPMLFFCFSITELKSATPILGRCANTKETADYIISKNNINIFLEMLKVFGTLSKNHNQDIITIIDTILK